MTRQRWIRYRATSTVRYVTQEKVSVYKSGVGPNTVYEEKPLDKWRVGLSGFGALVLWEKPEFEVGDTVNIIIERPVNAKSE